MNIYERQAAARAAATEAEKAVELYEKVALADKMLNDPTVSLWNISIRNDKGGHGELLDVSDLLDSDEKLTLISTLRRRADVLLERLK